MNYRILSIYILLLQITIGQTHIAADPYFLLLNEKNQFSKDIPMNSNIFRPIYFSTDTVSYSVNIRSEHYYNDNAPNQENMDVRYFSKGIANFNSINFVVNSPYFSLMVEPYIKNENFSSVKSINRSPVFNVLNDRPLSERMKPELSGFRNFMYFFHYKGVGFGWHEGNRWWGPGMHSSLLMTNNTTGLGTQTIGTIRELRHGRFGIVGLYSFGKMNNEIGNKAKYFTAINGQLTWYGSSAIVSAGFSREYLSGGDTRSSYNWSEKDARKIVFEGIFTSNLVEAEYTVGGHDLWDQTLSTFFSAILPEKNIKVYAELGFNDNRMFFADFLSQPDHSMATIFGIRNYGLGKNKNWIWGFEWLNLMITYSSRHRPLGGGDWYSRSLYNFSTYDGRRWGAHSGSDSDDWYFYIGYLSDKLMIVPAFNYERHGIVSNRPAEVKIEYRLDSRYKYKNMWFGIYFEKQFEYFLGFPDYFYVDRDGKPIDSSKGTLANNRKTNTLIFSFSKTINF